MDKVEKKMKRDKVPLKHLSLEYRNPENMLFGEIRQQMEKVIKCLRSSYSDVDEDSILVELYFGRYVEFNRRETEAEAIKRVKKTEKIRETKARHKAQRLAKQEREERKEFERLKQKYEESDK